MATLDECLSTDEPLLSNESLLTDEPLLTVEPSTNILTTQPPRFPLRSYLPSSASKTDLIGCCFLVGFIVLALIVTTVVVPIKMIIVGSLNTAHCPIQTKIPIFLLVSGIVSLVFVLLCIGIVTIKFADILHILGVWLCRIQFVLHILWFLWLISGLIWTVAVYESVQHTNSSLPTYCDKNTFEAIFDYFPIQGILSMISICLFGLCCCFRQHWFIILFVQKNHKKQTTWRSPIKEAYRTRFPTRHRQLLASTSEPNIYCSLRRVYCFTLSDVSFFYSIQLNLFGNFLSFFEIFFTMCFSITMSFSYFLLWFRILIIKKIALVSFQDSSHLIVTCLDI